MPLKVFDYVCGKCGANRNDQIVENGERVKCSCGSDMLRMFPIARTKDLRGPFQPFWSDTFQMRVNDREDLKKLQAMRKESGLECVGHTNMKPDKAAIRWNYEND